MRILVLGGTGFIGPPAVWRMAQWGHEVTLFHRGRSTAFLPSGVRHVHGDLARLAEHADALRALAPEVVLATQAYTEQDGRALVDTFRGVARRLVVLSSADVYRAYDRFRGADPGPPDASPLTEDSPLRDRLYPYLDPAKGPDDFANRYDKILVEQAVRSEPDALPATVLRLPMVYGPGDNQHRMFPYLKRMADNRPFILLPERLAGWRAPRGYVENMGDAIALCVSMDSASGRIYHVAEAEGLTEREWVRRIALFAGWKGEVVTLPDDELPAHLQHTYDTSQEWDLDTSRIRTELGYREWVPLDTGLQRTVSWERANPPVKVDPAEFDYAAEDAAVEAATAG